MNNFVKLALDNGGKIYPLIIPAELNSGLGLMNPSILIDDGKILVNLRAVNYTFYHSEEKLFQHQWGPLTYVHPEDDMHLRTTNYYLELDNDFNIIRTNKIDTSEFDTYEPQWEFVGLEDGRLIRWNEKLYITGVRRDLDTVGTGRMELSELEVGDDYVKEIARHRIPTPIDPNAYCEKNWMPLIDNPYHFVKWTNPTELVSFDLDTKVCNQVLQKTDPQPIPNSPRGGSQVISCGDYYLAITHEVDLFKSEVGRKDAIYRHRFIVWDKDWNIIKYSKDFAFMDGHVEFCVGLAEYEDDFLITFGFQDNAAYLLRVPQETVEDFINE